MCGKHGEVLHVKEIVISGTLTVTGNCKPQKGKIIVDKTPAVIVDKSGVILEDILLSSARKTALIIRKSNVSVRGAQAINSENGIVLSADYGLSDIQILESIVTDNRKVGIKLDVRKKNRDYNRFKISNNIINNNGSHGIRLWFRAKTKGTSSLDGVVIDKNQVEGNKGDGIVVIHQSSDYESPTPLIKNMIISGNTIQKNTGGIAIRGISGGLSNNPGQIIGNKIKNNTGVTGGINIFWSKNIVIENNIICCTSTNHIDGNGILVDHGNNNIKVQRNKIYNSYGNTVKNSGVGIMVLDNVDIEVENNVLVNNYMGIYLGGGRPSKRIKVKNNEIKNTVSKDLYIDKGYDITELDTDL